MNVIQKEVREKERQARQPAIEIIGRLGLVSLWGCVCVCVRECLGGLFCSLSTAEISFCKGST